MIKRKILTKSGAGIILLFLFALGIYFQPYRLGIVTGESMTPTLHSGQLLLIDRNYYKHHKITRGDVISCRVNGKTLVKRVYALPGDEVIQLHCDSDDVGDIIVRPHMIIKVIQSFIERPTAMRVIRFEVDSDFVYLLGDGGSLSIDSRNFGPVPQNQIIGKVVNCESSYGKHLFAVSML